MFKGIALFAVAGGEGFFKFLRSRSVSRFYERKMQKTLRNDLRVLSFIKNLSKHQKGKKIKGLKPLILLGRGCRS